MRGSYLLTRTETNNAATTTLILDGVIERDKISITDKNKTAAAEHTAMIQNVFNCSESFGESELCIFVYATRVTSILPTWSPDRDDAGNRGYTTVVPKSYDGNCGNAGV
jgi:hypothetical protein